MRGCVQASVNPKAETVEELQGRRKALHMGMLKLAREDLALALQAEHDSSVVLPPPHTPFCWAFLHTHPTTMSLLQPRAACETWLRSRQAML